MPEWVTTANSIATLVTVIFGLPGALWAWRLTKANTEKAEKDNDTATFIKANETMDRTMARMDNELTRLQTNWENAVKRLDSMEAKQREDLRRIEMLENNFNSLLKSARTLIMGPFAYILSWYEQGAEPPAPDEHFTDAREQMNEFQSAWLDMDSHHNNNGRR